MEIFGIFSVFPMVEMSHLDDVIAPEAGIYFELFTSWYIVQTRHSSHLKISLGYGNVNNIYMFLNLLIGKMLKSH